MLFRLVRNKEKSIYVGFKWIEVLAIEPAKESSDCFYVCRTNSGLVKISSTTLWHAINELQEYIEEGKNEVSRPIPG